MWHQLTVPPDLADVDRVVQRSRRVSPRCGDVVVITIDGPSGSGKTTLAYGVCAALGCQCVHMDQIFPGWDGLAKAVDFVTDQVLLPLARGEDASYRVWDWEHHRWAGSIAVPRAPVIVIEGCGSSVGRAGEFAAVRVWTTAPRVTRLERGLARDGEAFAPHWERWADQESALYALDGTAGRADIVVDTGGRA